MFNKSEFICSNCGFKGKPKKRKKGSLLLEICLWILAILPGVLYTVWRLTTIAKVCPKCGKDTMIPLSTPIGQKLSKELT